MIYNNYMDDDKKISSAVVPHQQSGLNRAGRPAGCPNKATTEFKEAVTALLNQTAPEYLQWLLRVSDDDPAKAFDVIAKLAEYAFPKLARQEHTGKDGAALEPTVYNITIEGVAKK